MSFIAMFRAGTPVGRHIDVRIVHLALLPVVRKA
jgi:hypothetical protein